MPLQGKGAPVRNTGGSTNKRKKTRTKKGAGKAYLRSLPKVSVTPRAKKKVPKGGLGNALKRGLKRVS